MLPTIMILQRVISTIPTLLGVATLAFLVNRVLPGDPARAVLGTQASELQLEALREQMGLNDPLWMQFLNYIWNLFRLDFGIAWHTSRPVVEDLGNRLPATIELALWAFIFALVIGIPIGMLQATRAGGTLDLLLRVGALVGLSVPSFWLGIQLIQIFYVQLQVAPAPSGRLSANAYVPERITGLYVLDAILQGEWGTAIMAAQHLVLPTFALGLVGVAVISRMTRSAMLDVLRRDYIRSARAKGVSPSFIIRGHALKNASPAIFTISAMQLGYLLAGAVVVEVIFGWPGIGSYIYTAVNANDYAPVQTVMVLTAGLFIFVNLLADVAQMIVDPKTRGV